MKTRWLALAILAVLLGATSPARMKALGVPFGAGQDHYDHDRGGWDQPPSEFRDVQRQGFHDGIEGARKDFDNHRRPDVNNRDEYRHPPVPRNARGDYRDGFRRGYQMAVSHMMGDRH